MSIILYIIGGVLAIIIVLAVIGWFMEVYESIRSLFTRNGTTNRISVSKTAEPANMKSVKPSNAKNQSSSAPRKKTDILLSDQPKPIKRQQNPERPAKYVPVTSAHQKDAIKGKENPDRDTPLSNHRSGDQPSNPKPVRYVPRVDSPTKDNQQGIVKPVKYKPKP
ncbi:MAG TPA: hypothetical protein P5518_03595 [Candidatus Cloacimonas sp.]|nr:hypothetical protein [Candidatus Cloacimonas sp.]